MDIGTISIVAAFITMLALLALGVHIGITLGLSGMLGFIIFHGKVSIAPIQLAFQQFLSVNTTYAFIIIPLFMLLGFLGSETGVAEDLFDAADKWFGHLRGGLAVTTIVACSGMAAITGSSLGTAVAMTKIALPQMRKHKYDDRLSLGAITVGATLSIMIPPSITLVLYGIFGQQSIGKLLIAGILPGLMTAFFYIIQIIVRCRIQPELCLLALKYNWRTKISSLPKVIPFVSVMVGMMAGILLGIWTPVEASGAGCIFVFLIALVRRRLRTRTFSFGMENVRD